MSRQPHIRSHEPILMEYLLKNYPPGSWQTNVRVGKPLVSEQIKLITSGSPRSLDVMLPIVDAIVLQPNLVTIIEVATEPKVEKVCQVDMYGHLFNTTERYRSYWHIKQDQIIVSTVANDFCRWFANKQGVRWVVYRPVWFDAHIATKQARKFEPLSVEIPQEKEQQ